MDLLFLSPSASSSAAPSTLAHHAMLLSLLWWWGGGGKDLPRRKKGANEQLKKGDLWKLSGRRGGGKRTVTRERQQSRLNKKRAVKLAQGFPTFFWSATSDIVVACYGGIL